MNTQNIKLSIRSLLKNKTVTSINIIGLTIGISISLLIFTYVRKEKTMDKDIANSDDIQLLLHYDSPGISKKMVEYIAKEIPEIEEITYCAYDWSPQVFFEKENNKYRIEKLLVADSSFFQVFQFEAIWGNVSNALNGANKVVLTESLSKKIFGNENPVGKSMQYHATYLSNELLEVGAVIKDLPQNSSWQFEAVLSMQTNYKISWYVRNMEHWGSQNYNAFFRTSSNSNKAQLKDKFKNISTSNLPEELKGNIDFSFYPFNKCYFNILTTRVLKHGNSFTLYVIRIIGILVLLLACMNYINLVTAQRAKRLKTIGIMKVMACSKKRIISLLTIESVLILLSTLILIGGLSKILLSGLNEFTYSNFSFSEIFLSGWNLFILFGIILLSLIITGFIPGYIFSKQKISILLKRQVNDTRAIYLRNTLLICQFVISISLLVCILVIQKQNKYSKHFNNGFTKESIIYMNTNDDLSRNIEAFTSEVLKIPGAHDYAFSEEPIGYINGNWGRMLIHKGIKKQMNFAKLSVSPNFFDFFGIKITEGRTFSENSRKLNDYIFNQSAIQEYAIENLSDARIESSNDLLKGNFIAKVEDFHFESVHVPIRPIGFMCSGKTDDVIYLKVSQDNYNGFLQTKKSIEQLWNKYSPNFPFEFKFLDESWNLLYTKDKQFQKVLSFSTIISLLLSCLGLIGISLFIIENRIKEIGVRKVNGAKTKEILAMLNKDFVKWIAIAFVIACPIAWYVMSKWLENFAYRTELSWWIFVLSGLIAMGIALLTVSLQSWRAAMRNPVESLRYE